MSVDRVRSFVQAHQAKQFDFMLNPLQTERRNWKQAGNIERDLKNDLDQSGRSGQGADPASSPGFPDRAHAEPQHPAHQAAGAKQSPPGVREHLDNMPVHPGYDPSAPSAQTIQRAVEGASKLIR